MSLKAQQRALKQAIVGGGEMAACSGLLRIYQHAYAARLTAALRDNFGVLPKVLGDDAFDAVALAYIAAQPSTRPSIRWFGDQLPDFMVAHEDLVPHPAIVDLAAMEWSLRCAFDAADADPLCAHDIAALPADAWPDMVLNPMPGLCLLRLRWNVGPVWRALQVDADVDMPEPEPLEHHLLIWRQGLTPRWRALDPTSAALLGDVLAGRTFGQLCERCAPGAVGNDAAAVIAASALRSWIDDGLLRR